MALSRPGERGGEALLSLARTKAEKRRAKATSILACVWPDASLMLVSGIEPALMLRGLLDFPALSLAGGASCNPSISAR